MVYHSQEVNDRLVKWWRIRDPKLLWSTDKTGQNRLYCHGQCRYPLIHSGFKYQATLEGEEDVHYYPYIYGQDGTDDGKAVSPTDYYWKLMCPVSTLDSFML